MRKWRYVSGTITVLLAVFVLFMFIIERIVKNSQYIAEVDFGVQTKASIVIIIVSCLSGILSLFFAEDKSRLKSIGLVLAYAATFAASVYVGKEEALYKYFPGWYATCGVIALISCFLKEGVRSERHAGEARIEAAGTDWTIERDVLKGYMAQNQSEEKGRIRAGVIRNISFCPCCGTRSKTGEIISCPKCKMVTKAIGYKQE